MNRIITPNGFRQSPEPSKGQLIKRIKDLEILINRYQQQETEYFTLMNVLINSTGSGMYDVYEEDVKKAMPLKGIKTEITQDDFGRRCMRLTFLESAPEQSGSETEPDKK